MGVSSQQVLSTTGTASSPWLNVAAFTTMSVYVQGLEVGGSVAVWMSNWQQRPDTLVRGNPADTGAKFLSIATTGNSISQINCPAVWMQFVKTAAGAAVPTTVCIAGSMY